MDPTNSPTTSDTSTGEESDSDKLHSHKRKKAPDRSPSIKKNTNISLSTNSNTPTTTSEESSSSPKPDKVRSSPIGHTHVRRSNDMLLRSKSKGTKLPKIVMSKTRKDGTSDSLDGSPLSSDLSSESSTRSEPWSERSASFTDTNADMNEAFSKLHQPIPAPTFTQDGERRIMASGTLTHVVQCYAADAPDIQSLRHLILAHQHFFPSTELLDHLITTFHDTVSLTSRGGGSGGSGGILSQSQSGVLTGGTSSGGNSPSDHSIIQGQFRLVNIIKTWLDTSYSTFSTNPILNSKLLEFVKYLTRSYPNLGEYLRRSISSASGIGEGHKVGTSSDDEDDDDDDGDDESPRPLPINPKVSEDDDWTIVDFDPLEIARQLCLIDYTLLKSIPITEYHNSKWINDQAPNIKNASIFSDKLSYWLGWCVLSESKIKNRSKILTHLIQIASHLAELHNYNSLMSVYLALSHTTVSKLYQSWKGLPGKSLHLWKKIDNLMNPNNNFNALRSRIKEVLPPMIPCQEIVLKDLLYQNEGSQDYLSDQLPIINMRKLDIIGKIISSVLSCQVAPYKFVKQSVIHKVLLNIPKIDSDHLHGLFSTYEIEESVTESFSRKTSARNLMVDLKDIGIDNDSSPEYTKRPIFGQQSESSSEFTSPFTHYKIHEFHRDHDKEDDD
eukprot:TRINITY_DN889_c0_g1_i4.p1 TRINITY_DN889_c0_g1~~TRINITY_DN889_c0_g1_i4.p1  ORF type:complete len:669 (-),score=124.48 TRINITY_DN889_c0_g1_i4:415-2421(-)